MKLIENWRACLLGAWSVRLGAAAQGLLILIWTWPESILAVWNMLPLEVRATFPPRVVIVLPIVLGAASLAARLIHQPKLKEATDAAAAQSD